MSSRRYAHVPVDKIRVLNARNRDQVRFEENVRSIKDVGLLKPVVVNERYREKTGCYDLVCGQGRYLAYKKLGRSEIPAEIIDCSKKDAYLYSLVENIARVMPGTMWFAREVKRMHDAGFTHQQLCQITGHSETYIKDYIRLAEQGEERLIRGVEEGLFSMTFAMQVAKSDSSTVQQVLMDAFDDGVVNSSNLPTVRKIVELRATRSKETAKGRHCGGDKGTPYTVKQLKSDITRVTKEKTAFVDEATVKENRLLLLLDGLHTLWSDKELSGLMKSEGIGPMPKLKGAYDVS